jgi:hypothetical protein
MSSSAFSATHDLGGKFDRTVEETIDTSHRPLQYWEYCIHALLVILATKSPPLMTTDELRRGVESLEAKSYSDWGYYDRWSSSMTSILLERGVITEQEINEELFGSSTSIDSSSEVFKVGDLVRVRQENTRSRWRKPHLRCPGYIFGARGRVEKYIGMFRDPYFLAFRGSGPPQHLYIISFNRSELWPEAGGLDTDIVTVEIYHNWLLHELDPLVKEPVEWRPSHTDHDHIEIISNGSSVSHENLHTENDFGHIRLSESIVSITSVASDFLNPDCGIHIHGNLQSEHGHHSHEGGGIDHSHEARGVVELTAIEKEGSPTPGREIGDALLRILLKKGIVEDGAINRTIEALDMAGKTL